jgi:hypothetical protein
VYGWEARGSGYASSVTADASKRFTDRLLQAKEALAAAAKIGRLDPRYCESGIKIELGMGGDHEKVQELVATSIKLTPAYFDTFRAASMFLSPRWHGEPGDIQAFANDLFEQLGPKYGSSAFLHAVRAVSFYDPEGTWQSEFNWDYFRAAIEHEMQLKPAPGDLLRIALDFAWNHQDINMARRAAKYFDELPLEQRKPFSPREMVVIDMARINPANLSDLFVWLPQAGDLFDLDFSGDGTILAVAGTPTPRTKGPLATLVDVKSATVIGSTSRSDAACRFVRFAGQQRQQLLFESINRREQTVQHVLFDGTSDKPPIEFDPVKVTGIHAAAVSNDGEHLAVLDERSNAITVFEVQTGKKRSEFKLKTNCSVLTFHPDNQRLAVMGAGWQVYNWEGEVTEVIPWQQEGWNFSKAAGYDPKGRLLVLVSNGKANNEMADSWFRFDPATKVREEITPAVRSVKSFRVCPRQRYFISTNHDRTNVNSVQVYDLLLEKLIFNGPIGAVRAAISPDGTRLATVGSGGMVRMYPIPPPDAVP